MASQRKTALVVCPGRGTYNAAELGYLARHHDGGGKLVAHLDALRGERGQPTITQLDSAEKFSTKLHMTGDNASLLIYACAMADFAAIDRERFDIVAVTGNSMGWYLALAAAGALSVENAAQLVNEMGVLMHADGTGGQVVYPLVDEEWRVDPARATLVRGVLANARSAPDVEIHVSIRLGGLIVFAANDAGLAFLMDALPATDRFPMRLNHHAAFHSPLLESLVPAARQRNDVAAFGNSSLPLIDGRGAIWSPKAYDQSDLFDYTLGHQICRTYDFSAAIRVGVKEFAPDRVIVLGPGTTLGAPVAQTLIAEGWRGLDSKSTFQARQKDHPYILSMGIDAQSAIAMGT